MYKLEDIMSRSQDIIERKFVTVHLDIKQSKPKAKVDGISKPVGLLIQPQHCVYIFL
jgi:hypothetical protein